MRKLLTDEGIVMKNFKFKETSVIIEVFFLNLGLVSCIANGVRKTKSTFSSGSFQPISYNEFVLYHQDVNQLSRIKESKILAHWHEIYQKFDRTLLCLFIIECVKKSLSKGEKNETLFYLLRETLIQIENIEKHPNTSLWFLFNLAENLGFGFQQFFKIKKSLNQLTLDEIQIIHSIFPILDTSPKLSEALFQINNLDLNQANTIHIPLSHRLLLIENLCFYFNQHIPQFTKLNSLKLFKETLN